MKKRIITPAIFLSAQILAGCTSSEAPTQPGSDELAGETSQDGETPKADAAHDNFGFIAVEKSGAFDCHNPLTCISYELSRPNRSTIQCNDGAYHDQCGVKAINWDKAGLTSKEQQSVESAIEREAQDPSIGVQVLVKGQYKIYVDFLAFEPTEVWLAAKANGTTDGTFVRIFDRGIRCITAPCPQYEEGRLNSSREMPIDGIDYADDNSLQDKVYEQTTQPDGIIVVGERTTRGTGRLQEKLRTADQVFFPIGK
ncbi:MAG: hypothetical protein JO257_10720 [Deltaproteobacteria bacterium]|nr:hypothetical protein [Deltaproteobacteria bacterium]